MEEVRCREHPGQARKTQISLSVRVWALLNVLTAGIEQQRAVLPVSAQTEENSTEEPAAFVGVAQSKSATPRTSVAQH